MVLSNGFIFDYIRLLRIRPDLPGLLLVRLGSPIFYQARPRLSIRILRRRPTVSMGISTNLFPCRLEANRLAGCQFNPALGRLLIFCLRLDSHLARLSKIFLLARRVSPPVPGLYSTRTIRRVLAPHYDLVPLWLVVILDDACAHATQVGYPALSIVMDRHLHAPVYDRILFRARVNASCFDLAVGG